MYHFTGAIKFLVQRYNGSAPLGIWTWNPFVFHAQFLTHCELVYTAARWHITIFLSQLPTAGSKSVVLLVAYYD